MTDEPEFVIEPMAMGKAEIDAANATAELIRKCVGADMAPDLVFSIMLNVLADRAIAYRQGASIPAMASLLMSLSGKNEIMGALMMPTLHKPGNA